MLALRLFVLLIVLSSLGPAGARGGDQSLLKTRVLAGPVAARVVRVIDGDTLEAAVDIWLDQTLIARVRLAGIDSPETARAACADERARGEAAKEFLAARLAGRRIRLSEIRHDKYGGRVLARVADDDGTDIAALMIDRGLAAAYGAGETWCPAG